MARYFDPPVDYRPGVIFQLRHRLEGGALRQTVLELRNGAGDGRREAVVVVHGFNNHYGEAATAFQGFRNQQYRRDPNLLPPSLETMLADAHWPGDAAWGKADLVDFLVYPFAVGTAKKAGPVLANFLGRLPNLEIVHFIGHSLGCRVVLEAIRALAARPRVGKVCLMAAAVPVFQVEWGGRLESAMVRAQQVLVLYSGRDIVLTGAFPPRPVRGGAWRGHVSLGAGTRTTTADRGGDGGRNRNLGRGSRRLLGPQQHRTVVAGNGTRWKFHGVWPAGSRHRPAEHRAAGDRPCAARVR